MPKEADSVSDQYARFVETARALGCDEDEAAFDEKLKKLVPPKASSPSAGDGVPKSKPSGRP